MEHAYGRRIYSYKTPIALGGALFERGHAVMVMCGGDGETDAGTVLINFSVAPSWSSQYGWPTADGLYMVNIYKTGVRGN
jgi:hypothetical protein